MPPRSPVRPTSPCTGRSKHTFGHTFGLFARALAWASLGLTCAACRSTSDHVADADREVYGILEKRLAALAAGDVHFSIEPPKDSLRLRLLAGTSESLSPLTLVECLRIAAEDNERYRSAREGLYLEALGLTLDRWRFGLQPSAGADASLTGTGDDSSSASFGGNFQLRRLLGSGAQVVADIGASLFRVVTTGDGFDLVTDLGLSITQPLLRGFGSAVTLEPLTQAERDLVYQVRGYERFRRTFAVEVAGQVYGILESYDSLSNEERNLENLSVLRTRNERLAEAGQLSEIQADQARQDELRSEIRLVARRAALERQLDQFKIFLGLPVEVEIAVDRGEFDRLDDEDALLSALDATRSVEFAQTNRLDVATSAQGVEDAERALGLAADDLRAGLGLAAGVDSTSANNNPTSHRAGELRWSLALDLDLPIDRLPERNAYRSALIRLEASRRAHGRFLDRISADVRDAIRSARDARDRYRIQINAVELAARRVRSSELNLQAGRASTRDLLEAQDALLEAENARTAALIDYTLASLALYLELEILRVDADGIHVDPELSAQLVATE